MVQTIQNNLPNRQYMTQEQFYFWLQGLFELCPDLKCLTEAQVKQIREHLDYVFNGKVTQSSVQFTPLSTAYKSYADSLQGGAVGGGIASGSDHPIITTVC